MTRTPEGLMDTNRVLLVAREREAGDLYGLILGSGAGTRSLWVPDAATASQFVNGLAFDAVIFDVTLPSEWHACEALARGAGAPPVIVITGWVAHDGRFRRRAFEAGCAAFIRKPCEPRTLVDALARVQRGERHLEIL